MLILWQQKYTLVSVHDQLSDIYAYYIDTKNVAISSNSTVLQVPEHNIIYTRAARFFLTRSVFRILLSHVGVTWLLGRPRGVAVISNRFNHDKQHDICALITYYSLRMHQLRDLKILFLLSKHDMHLDVSITTQQLRTCRRSQIFKSNEMEYAKPDWVYWQTSWKKYISWSKHNPNPVSSQNQYDNSVNIIQQLVIFN